ncbi:unnamed protein product [Lepeophtheirus salmonis]|uniref:(salmon louse) hypothetical protein n=1 Tax=Lepeophtheirus salmonis TaxID=72036 RepID=A0A7R8CRJ2_LEPSM|nr:unnamed protein product [Lepeophtheirus salmonis]CAF2905602.1 unnamed protein product [Lepeophtheirus salmonis]
MAEGADDENGSESDDILIIDECIRSDKKSPKLGPGSSYRLIDTDEKKFEQVENELEALFAGVESDDGKVEKNLPKEETKVKTPPSKATSPTPPPPRPVALPPSKPPKKETVKKRAEKSTPKSQVSSNKSLKLKRKKNLTKQESLLEKYKGPFLRIEGPDPFNPVWSNIINFSHDPLTSEAEVRLWSSIDGISEHEHHSRMAGLTSAALLTTSSYYDENWICVFCKNRSHYQGLGDLFGPYYVPSELMKDFTVPKKSKPSDLASKFILGGAEPASKKRKRKKSAVNEASLNASVTSANAHPNEVEVWMHEDCICWIQDIQILGHRLIGLERAIEDSNKTRCAICSLNGCSFGCSSIGCRRVAHYPCALMSKWTLDEKEFQAFCLDHSSKD